MVSERDSAQPLCFGSLINRLLFDSGWDSFVAVNKLVRVDQTAAT